MIMLGVALFHVCFCLCMQCVGVLVYESCVIFFFLVLYVDVVFFFFFFFSSRRRHTRLVSDSSSDVCSSDLHQVQVSAEGRREGQATCGSVSRTLIASTRGSSLSMIGTASYNQRIGLSAGRTLLPFR